MTTTQMLSPRTAPDRQRREASASAAEVATAKPAPNKSATINRLLSRTKGATVAELVTATDWQPHSVRAYFSGLRKKGHNLVREQRKGGEQAYRIVTAIETVAAEPAVVAIAPEAVHEGDTVGASA